MQSLQPCASYGVETPRRRIGSWLPDDHRVVRGYVREKVAQANISPVAMLVAPVQQFSEIIYGDPILLMLANQMLVEVPTTPPYDSDVIGNPAIRDLDVLLQTINLIVQEPPAFVKGANDYEFVGFPINAILNWPMSTKSGMMFFGNPVVNAALKQVLSYWATFLASPASTTTLTTSPDGWFGPAARSRMPNFVETFVCDPNKHAYGFASFDAFFTRLFRPGVRPVPAPGDPNVIISACESQVYRITSSVQRVANFNLKGQPYSLENMLDRDPSVSQFVGGTVYQAFLSALKYHRWHAPVDGI
ncbi:hypothetical protein FRC00_009419, partial [Tulasnella sp. 408]